MRPTAPVRLAIVAGHCALAGCGRPDFSEAPVSTPPVTTAPAPSLPAWAQGLLGKGVRDVFPQVASCAGSVDRVDLRFEGPVPGSRIIGWAWDLERKSAPPRIVLADKQFRIVGAGETGLPRPDVVQARPDITSPTTGWQAQTPNLGGPVYAFAADLGTRACRLGRLDL
jgi:hypothetical protein